MRAIRWADVAGPDFGAAQNVYSQQITIVS